MKKLFFMFVSKKAFKWRIIMSNISAISPSQSHFHHNHHSHKPKCHSEHEHHHNPKCHSEHPHHHHNPKCHGNEPHHKPKGHNDHHKV